MSLVGLGSGFAIGYGYSLLTRPRVYSLTRPGNYDKNEGPLRCATTNTSVIFAKADYEGQDIDIKQDEVECKVGTISNENFTRTQRSGLALLPSKNIMTFIKCGNILNVT